MSSQRKTRKVCHNLFISCALGVMMGCSLLSHSTARSQSLSGLAQNDPDIVLAGTDGCPEADPNFVGGCLRVPERRGATDSTTLQIFFQYVGEPKEDRDTVVVLNGGPGGALTFYAKIPQFLALAEKYNVIFYDQRGVARSSAITNANVASLDLNNYGTPENVEDLSDLVTHVVKKPILVLGHSYGAHLGFAFAVQHPEQVKAYMALNGSSDNLGILLQPRRKTELIQKGLAEIEGEQFNVLLQLIQQGKAHDAAGKVISIGDFQLNMSLLVSTFQGQKTGIKDYLNALVKANAEEMQKIRIAGTTSRSESPAPLLKRDSPEPRLTRFDFVTQQDLNFFVNTATSCGEMFREETFSVLQEADKTFALKFREAVCANSPKAPVSRIFDTKPHLNKIKSPVLIVSGDSDPLVAPEAQKRDFELLKSLGADVTLWTFQETGHQIFTESPTCTQKVFSEFLAHVMSAESGVASEHVCVEKP